ncbi:MAG: SDR family NAD(P)-dependent oxidoreductase [Rhodobacteraceae bacterium]|nr:SDR family NAD(P)-dependent oxidoreductase [Paracoccaceae bacterium]
MRICITGASRGIGLGLARSWAAAGHEVIGTHRGIAPDVSAIRWVEVALDRPESLAALARALEPEPLDLLVCNAGVFPDKGHGLESGLGPEIWHEAFSINVTGAFLSLRAALPALRRARSDRGFARVAMISSIMASSARAPGGSYAYRASKAALTNLARNLATDLEPEAIAVGAYHPGWVRTDMGGPDADIDLSEAVAGLVARIEALSPRTTGCFESHDGAPIAF